MSLHVLPLPVLYPVIGQEGREENDNSPLQISSFPRIFLWRISLSELVVHPTMEPVSVCINVEIGEVSELPKRMVFEVVDFNLLVVGWWGRKFITFSQSGRGTSFVLSRSSQSSGREQAQLLGILESTHAFLKPWHSFIIIKKLTLFFLGFWGFGDPGLGNWWWCLMGTVILFSENASSSFWINFGNGNCRIRSSLLICFTFNTLV